MNWDDVGLRRQYRPEPRGASACRPASATTVATDIPASSAQHHAETQPTRCKHLNGYPARAGPDTKYLAYFVRRGGQGGPGGVGRGPRPSRAGEGQSWCAGATAAAREGQIAARPGRLDYRQGGRAQVIVVPPSAGFIVSTLIPPRPESLDRFGLPGPACGHGVIEKQAIA